MINFPRLVNVTYRGRRYGVSQTSGHEYEVTDEHGDVARYTTTTNPPSPRSINQRSALGAFNLSPSDIPQLQTRSRSSWPSCRARSL